MTSNRPIRVLHCFGSLGKGGIETWLINILRLRPDELEFDFLLGTLGGAYEAEARSYGCHIYQAPPIRQLNNSLRFLGQTLASNSYNVLHCHGEEFMGDFIKVAFNAGVPVRVAHCHGTALARGKKNAEMMLRTLRFRTLDRMRIMNYATDIVAASNDSGRFLMGRHWKSDPRCRALYCGVPLADFENALIRWTRADFRASQGIPQDAIVLGHAGSMGPAPLRTIIFFSRYSENWRGVIIAICYTWRVTVHYVLALQRRCIIMVCKVVLSCPGYVTMFLRSWFMDSMFISSRPFRRVCL